MQHRASLCKTLILFLLGSSIAGCGGLASREVESPVLTIASPSPPATASPRPMPSFTQVPDSAALATRFAFPSQVDPSGRYLFYLHGKIIEDQGLPAVSPEFGEYRYADILKVLEDHGFVVISEPRPKDADGWAYARKVAGQIADLLSAGVPASRITVVGASKGAAIAAGVSNIVREPEVNYVLLGTCHPTQIDEWRKQRLTLSGNVLAIHDIADDEYSGSCEDLFARSEGHGLGRHAELVLQVGTGHGILYAPLDEWVFPTVRWAGRL